MPRLEELSLGIGWEKHFWFPDLLDDKMLLGWGIKRIHIKSFKRPVAPFITSSSISALTHLSLNVPSFGSLSPFEMVLKYGRNLRSLRIKGNLDPRTSHSQYFRRYTHALPYLTKFGIYVSVTDGLHLTDTDFFPSVCDFLIPKAVQLIHLELTAPRSLRGREKLGFDGGKWCWGMLKPNHSVKMPFPKLESLSMTLPAGHKSFSIHCSKLIPKGLTMLTLSGEQLPHKFTKIFAIVRFPPECIIAISDRSE
jgi:hypothetical protein